MYTDACKQSMVTIDMGQYQFGNYWQSNHHFVTGKGDRFEKQYIHFSKEFSSPPQVQCNISGFDTSNWQNTRLEVYPTDITCVGFLLNVKTWANSITYQVNINWMAVG